MKQLFQQIDEIVPKLQGWCTPLKANNLAALIVALRPSLTVEIGIFGGRSFLPMAMAHRFIQSGIAVGIEPWTQVSASEGYSGADKEWWGKKVNFAEVQSTFLRNLNSLNLRGHANVL